MEDKKKVAEKKPEAKKPEVKEVKKAEVKKEPVKVAAPIKALAAKPAEVKQPDKKEVTRVFVPKAPATPVAKHTEAPVVRLAPTEIRVKKSGTKIKSVGTPATGRRKKSIARVRLLPGTGKITVNDRPLDEYFVSGFLRLIVNQPFQTVSIVKYDVFVNVKGGGLTGQAGAIRHGISRALVKENETLKPELKKAGFLKRDPRMKERKKYGLKKARRAPQFSKR